MSRVEQLVDSSIRQLHAMGTGSSRSDFRSTSFQKDNVAFISLEFERGGA